MSAERVARRSGDHELQIDRVIREVSGGTACPVTFKILDLSGAAPVISKGLGTCSHDSKFRFNLDGSFVIVSAKVNNDGPATGSTPYVYRKDVVMEEK